MKKTILTLFSIVFIGASFAQGVTIFLDGTAIDISGQTHVYNIEVETSPTLGNDHAVDFLYNNESGVDRSWIITRNRISEPANWKESVCWGLDGAIGNCYVWQAPSMWSTNPENITAGNAGRLSTYITSPSSGSAMYRYYVSTDGINFIDSVDLQINSTLSVSENPSFSVNVAPNPSSDFITISTNGSNSSTIKMVDVLGNLVLNEEIIGATKKIDVKKFRNGIYFLTVITEGTKPVTRKIIVRH